jgi:hypothetical protein
MDANRAGETARCGVGGNCDTGMLAVRGRRYPALEEAIAVLLAPIDRFGWSDNGRADAFCPRSINRQIKQTSLR